MTAPPPSSPDRAAPSAKPAPPLRVFHVSDLHFGRPVAPDIVEAIEAHIAVDRYDVVAVSGDLSQRARAGEFQRAAVFLRDAARVSRVIVVPGNHDVAWWRSPLHARGAATIYEPYRTYISADLEPVLRAPGATFVGLNTAQGVSTRTLTWNLRDVSIIGDLRRSQIEWARRQFLESPDGDARVIVMHHNPMPGELSRRHGLKNTRRVLGAFAQIGVDLVLCGHDHQEAIHYVEHTRKGTVISTAGTISNRSRGGRPSSTNVITIRSSRIEVKTLVWSAATRTFVDGPAQAFDR
ncbi:MAG TPA: metallophosphoesterase [Gemmatimonadaceae bacterium]|nr:metallophosphoesterase [Gemmatimonadaceae bacterium]